METLYHEDANKRTHSFLSIRYQEKGKLGANAMKRVAAGAHLPTHWQLEPAKRPDDRAEYCLDVPPDKDSKVEFQMSFAYRLEKGSYYTFWN